MKKDYPKKKKNIFSNQPYFTTNWAPFANQNCISNATQIPSLLSRTKGKCGFLNIYKRKIIHLQFFTNLGDLGTVCKKKFKIEYVNNKRVNINL